MLKYFLLIVLPIIIGGLIYLCFHAPNLALHQYIQTPNFYHQYKGNRWFIVMLNHLPDFLWAFSLSSFLYIFLAKYNIKLRAVVCLVILLFSEIAQLYAKSNLTFDWVDVLVMYLATALAFYLSILYEK